MCKLMLSSTLALAAFFATPRVALADSFAAAYSVNDDAAGGEAGFEWCRKGSLTAAKRCALDACEENSDRECELTVWCEPGAWSGVVAINSAGGVKHVAVCEKSSRNAVLKALKAECRAVRRSDPSGFESCLVESLVGPESETSDTDIITWKYRKGELRAVD